MPGTQAQKVILVAFGPHDPPATTVTLELALGLDPELELDPALVGVEDPLLLHAAASSSRADAPAITGSVCRNRDIICKLLEFGTLRRS
jgi:hypothetical protein